MLLCDPTSGLQVHTLERMLSTMRNIRSSILELVFYSYQRTWRHSRKQHIFSNPQDTPDVCIFHGKVSTISDTYLHSVLNGHFSSIEQYTLLWSEQHLNLKTCASDHHMKYSGRVLQPGSSRQRDAPIFIYKAQNTQNGSFPVSVFTHSTSCDDVTLQRAHDGYNQAKDRHGHPDTTYAVNDFPTRDGPATMQLLCPSRGLNSTLQIPIDMEVKLIGDDKVACDEACALVLRTLNPQDKVFFWDTESVTYVTGQGTNEQRCSLVQVCASNQLTVLFHVGTWTTMFASFQSLFEDDTIKKVAHYVQHDLKHLTSKFPTLQVKNAWCFLKTCPEFFPRGARKGLDEVVKRVCGVHLNKRIDHAMWCVPGLLPRHINYAVLDVYALFNMYTKYMQAPLKDSTSLFVSEVSISSEDEDECPQPQPLSTHRIIPPPSVSTHRTVNEDSEEEDQDGVFFQDGHEDIPDEGHTELGADLLLWCRNAIDKFAKDTRKESLLLPGALSADQRKNIHDYADTYRLFHQSEGPRTCRRIRISRIMPRVSITPDQAHEWEGVQVTLPVPHSVCLSSHTDTHTNEYICFDADIPITVELHQLSSM